MRDTPAPPRIVVVSFRRSAPSMLPNLRASDRPGLVGRSQPPSRAKAGFDGQEAKAGRDRRTTARRCACGMSRTRAGSRLAVLLGGLRTEPEPADARGL